MKKIFLFFAVLSLMINAKAQTWNKNLQGTAASFGEEVIIAADGNYVFVGKNGDTGAGDISLTKTDINGNIIWQKYYGLSSYSGDVGNSVCQLNNGTYVIGGQIFDIVNFKYTAALLKIDASGNLIAVRLITGNAGGAAGIIYSVRATSDGGFICCGQTDGFGVPFIWKFDVNLNRVWGKYLGGYAGAIYSIQQTTDGGYIAASGNNSAFSNGLYKIDANGNLIWARTFDFGGTEYIYSVKQTTDGGYVLSGYSSTLGGCPFVIKTDANGFLGWNERLVLSTAGLASYSVVQTNDGGYAVGVLGTGSAPGIVKLQSDGTVSWAKSYTGSVKRLIQTSASDLVAVGNTTHWSATQGIYLFKTQSNGENCAAQNVSVTTNLADAGVSTPSATLNNSFGLSAPTISSGNSTLTLNSKCNCADAGPNKSNVNQPCCVPACTAVQIGTSPVTGINYSWTPCDGTLSSCTVAQPNASPCVTKTYTLTISGSSSTCFANISDVVTVTTNNTAGCCAPPNGPEIGKLRSTDSEIASESFSIFPNPNTGEFRIELGGSVTSLVQVSDITGRIVYTKENIPEKNLLIDLSKQSKGIYILKVVADSKETIKKIIVE